MKRQTIILIPLLMLISGVFLMTSCIRDNDESIAKDKMEQLMETIENKDSVALKSLFSNNKLVNIENFDIKADALFSYVQGNYVPLAGVGPAAFAQKENGNIRACSHKLTKAAKHDKI